MILSYRHLRAMHACPMALARFAETFGLQPVTIDAAAIDRYIFDHRIRTALSDFQWFAYEMIGPRYSTPEQGEIWYTLYTELDYVATDELELIDQVEQVKIALNLLQSQPA